MGATETFVWIELGVLLGLLVPWARGVWARHLGRGQGAGPFKTALRRRLEWGLVLAKKYAPLLLASNVIAFFVWKVVAPRMGLPLDTSEQAVIVGFLADSLCGKFLLGDPTDGFKPRPDLTAVNK